jgi:hypothetical protein
MSEETYKPLEKQKDKIHKAYVAYGFPSTTGLTQRMIKEFFEKK